VEDDDALPPLEADGDSDDNNGDNNQGRQYWQPAHARRQRVPNRQHVNDAFVNVSRQDQHELQDSFY
jgi:hypothetical protein